MSLLSSPQYILSSSMFIYRFISLLLVVLYRALSLFLVFPQLVGPPPLKETFGLYHPSFEQHILPLQRTAKGIASKLLPNFSQILKFIQRNYFEDYFKVEFSLDRCNSSSEKTFEM